MPKLLLNALFLLACVTLPARAADYTLETLAEGFDYPWSIAFLPGGEYLVTERSGQLLRVDAAGNKTSLSDVPATYVAGQGGFFDIVLHPQFSENRWVYLSYAHGTPDANGTGVVRATLGDSGLLNSELILLSTPTRATPQHYGGRMLFLPDGTLLVTIGEGFEYREGAQDIDRQLGKILRINDDGSIPSDNPFAERGGPAAKVWSLGHRNSQGLTLDRANNVVYMHEHGPRGGDEINVVEPGKNYGWPAITWGVDYSGAHVSPFSEYPGMQQPIQIWVPSIAPSGLAFYDGAAFPQWRGSLFSGALVNQEVRRTTLSQGKVESEEALFGELGARIRDIRQGPDGLLYILTDHSPGKVVRVVPVLTDQAG